MSVTSPAVETVPTYLRKFYTIAITIIIHNTVLNSPQFTEVKPFTYCSVQQRTLTVRPATSELSCHVTVFAHAYKV